MVAQNPTCTSWISSPSPFFSSNYKFSVLRNLMSTAIVAATWLFQGLSLVALLVLLGYAFLSPSRGHTATALVGILLFTVGMFNIALLSGASFSTLVEQILSIVAVLCFSITAIAQIVAMGETWYPAGGSLNRAYGTVRLGCAVLAILGIAAIGVALSSKEVILPTSVASGLSIATNSFSLCTLWASTWYTWQPTHTEGYFLTKDAEKRHRRAQDAWRLRCYMGVLSLYTIMTIVIMALSAQYNNAAESAWLWIRLLLLLSCQISVPSSWLPSSDYDLDQLEEQRRMHIEAPDIRKLSPTPDGGQHVTLEPPPPVPVHGSPQSLPQNLSSPQDKAIDPEQQPQYQPPPNIEAHYNVLKKPTLLIPPVLNSNDASYRIPSVRISALSMSNVWNDKDGHHS